MASRRANDRGFSIIELVIVMVIATILLAVSAAPMQQALDSMRLGQTAREVERELQTARLKAVSTNRRLRVRMNCPAAGSFRIVEFLGSVAADAAANRCDPSIYPYPAADRDPVTLPNFDGPVRALYPGATVTSTTLEFRPDGTAWTISAAGAAEAIPLAGVQLTLTRKTKTKVIGVNALGKISAQ